MAIRSRLRRAFTRGSEDDPNLSSKISSKGKNRAKTDPNVYQPGEKMPPLKYRRPVAPEHKALLESFDWAKAWRPRSVYSVYSPMGSRMPSRRNSFQAPEIPAVARSNNDFSKSDDDSVVDSGIGASIAGDDEPPSLSHEDGEESGEINGSWEVHMLLKRVLIIVDAENYNTMNNTPFTQEDLELALQRSNINSAKKDSCISNNTLDKPTIFHVEHFNERGPLLTA